VSISPLSPPNCKLLECDGRDTAFVAGMRTVIAFFVVGIVRGTFCAAEEGWEVGSEEGPHGGGTCGGDGEVYFDNGEGQLDAVEGVAVGIGVVEQLDEADDACDAYGGDTIEAALAGYFEV
jgi:hypothetical protein